MTRSDQPLRICHLASGDLWAGAEVMVYELLRELHLAADVRVSAIVLNRGRLERELRAAGVTVRVIEEGAHGLPSLVRRIRRELARQSVDIVHAHRYKENLLAWLCGGGAIRLATQHGLPETLGLGPRLKQWLNFQLLGRTFDRVVAVSSELGERLSRDWRLSAARLTVIPNGVTVPARDTQREQQRPLVIGSAGRLVPVKDFPLLIDTAAMLRHAGEPVRFVLAGDGPQYAQLRELIDHHALAKDFNLLGEVADMGAFYRGLDIYISTSRHEGLPMSILEAMAHALPIIAPAVGGIVEVVREQREGLLIVGRDPVAYAQGCRRLLRDHDFRHRAGAAGRARVLAEFSTARMAERYRELCWELYGERWQLNPSQPPLKSRGGAKNLHLN